MLVVNKPSGLLSNPGRDPAHHDSILSRVRANWPGAELVHRLDMDTSGIMVVALNKAAERALKGQFQCRAVSKEYQAWVWGQPANAAGEIDLPLICDWPRRPLQKVCFEHGKPALTRYRVLSRAAEQTLVALYPVTGRSHQLRVHMLSLGHPILGDRFYGTPEIASAHRRLLLHANRLSLSHPQTSAPMEFAAAPGF